jgi:hypothetical protein
VLDDVRALSRSLDSLSVLMPDVAELEAVRAERRRALERLVARLGELRAHLARMHRRAGEEDGRVPAAVAERLRTASSVLLEAHWLACRATQRGRTATRLLDALECEGERLERSADALRDLGLVAGALVAGRARVA